MISSGIYRTPANALKELISNSFDADAKKVVINTDYPDFDTITYTDDGLGISIPKIEQIMKRIGGSSKRDESEITPSGRPLIGRIGIGILAVAQICRRFTIVSSVSGAPKRFEVVVDLSQYYGQDINRYSLDDPDIPIGEYLYYELPEEKDVHYTRIILQEIDEGFKRGLEDSANPNNLINGFQLKKTDPRSFEEFTIWLDNKKIREIPVYLRLLWELAVISPVRYLDNGPIVGHNVIGDIRQKLEKYNFKVFVDGIELRKPIKLPYNPTAKIGLDYDVYDDLSLDKDVDGKRLSFKGYFYSQSEKIEPPELRGILVRIRNVAIGNYDRTLFNFPQAAGPIISSLTGEIYVTKGLEDALNVDRNSFRETDPHYEELQKYIFRRLAQNDGTLKSIAATARERSRKRVDIRRKSEARQYMKALEDSIEEVTGKKYTIKELQSESDRPVSIDLRQRSIIVYDRAPLFPRRRRERLIYKQLLIFYELATAERKDKRHLDEIFYRLLG